MARTEEMAIGDLLTRHESAILEDWVRIQAREGRRSHSLSDDDLQEESRTFLSLLRTALQNGQAQDIQGRDWAEVRRFLEDLSRNRAALGLTPSQTVTFVFSLKEALFPQLQRDLAKDPSQLAAATWSVSTLLDRLGLYITEVYQKGREELISRQQQEMLELSTPVVELWDGVLALPMIGTLDSARTQVVMENLLQRIVETGAGDCDHRHHRRARPWTRWSRSTC